MEAWEIRLEGFFHKNPDLDKEEIKRELLHLAATTLYSLDDLTNLIVSLSTPYKVKIDKDECYGLLGITRISKENYTKKKRIGKFKKSYFAGK